MELISALSIFGFSLFFEKDDKISSNTIFKVTNINGKAKLIRI